LCERDFGVQKSLEQGAFELPTIPGPLTVNAAAAAHECRARLMKLLSSLEPKPKILQSAGIISRLQCAIGKDDAVAAQAALPTQLFRRTIHHANGDDKLTESAQQRVASTFPLLGENRGS
jgi:hypothetical protein